jgi:outer membrane PBP1 activator LpoA protein
MKKIIILLILTYLFNTINSRADNQNSEENNLENEKILKIGVLLPLSGEFQSLGESFLRAIQLALYDISNENIKIYPKDSKANALDVYRAAKEFENLGIKIVIGPIFYESLERLNEINNITFISMTNKTQNIPKNTIAFGINIESQINALKEYFNKINISKTLLLSPKSEFIYQSESVVKKDLLKFYRTYKYDVNPKK